MALAPTLLQGPEPVETADLHFKLFCKLKVFESGKKHENVNCSLLAVSQYYGLIFVGNSNGFSVIQTKSVKSAVNSNDYPKKDVVLNLRPTHITVDFSQKLLGVVCSSKQGAIFFLYSIASLSSKDVTPIKNLLLSNIAENLAAEVSEISWQPNPDGTLMVCMSDGSVLSLNPSKEDSVHSLHKSTQSVCFCWSPKGKQVVIGCANGDLSRYKPDLKFVKAVPAPPLFNGAVTVVSVLWISCYQFAVAYNEKNNSTLFPVITIVNAELNKPVTFINYNDITFSGTFFRNHQIYMYHQKAWNLIFISSANSVEVAALNFKDNSEWEQWLLGDASRAELPLNSNKEETFPLGLAFDYTSQDTIPWGESSLPPMPRLLLLSCEGVLCVFNIVNLAANAPQLCEPPKECLPDHLFEVKPIATNAVAPAMASVSHLPSLAEPKQLQTSQPFSGQSSFDTPKPAFTFGMNTNFGKPSTEAQTATPQVTISVPGGGIVGGIKDVPFILQQQQQLQNQQQQQQQQQQLQHQQQQQQLQNQQLQQQHYQQKVQSEQQQFLFQRQQQQSFAFCQTLLANGKESTNAAQFGPSTATKFSFDTSGSTSPFVTNLTFGTKPAGSQPDVAFTVASAPSAKPTITQGNLPKGKPLPQADIFAGKTTLPQSTPIKPVESEGKPIPKSAVGKEKETAPKIQEGSVGGGSPAGSSSPALAELASVDDSVYWNALQDEIDHFNSELQHLSVRFGRLDFQVGTEEDKTYLRKTIEGLFEFWKDVRETTVSQSSEIHSVITDLMESFAWLEDAKSRNVQRKNPSFIELKKSEELDPISARHMSEIGHLRYYIENQLKQLTSHLEKEWMTHQDNYRMDVKSQMKVPPLEEVYKAMHYQLKILSKQKNLVEELKSKIAAKKRLNKLRNPLSITSQSVSSPSQGSNRISELSKLADNLLQLKINREEKSVENWEIMKSQLKTISERSKKLTSEKQAALREVLSERDMVRIRPVKSSIESSSFIRSSAVEKSAREAAATAKTESKVSAIQKEKVSSAPVESTKLTDVKRNSEKIEKPPEKQEDKKPESPKSLSSEKMADKPIVSVQQPAAKPEEQSPLDSLSGMISNMGREADAKPKVITKGFCFGAPEATKESSFAIASTENKPQEKIGETKTVGIPKPSEPVFGRTMEAPKFDGKPTFDFAVSSSTSAKPDAAKGTGSTAVSGTTAGTAFSNFTFTFAAQPTGFAFPRAAENKTVAVTQASVITSKAETETAEVDVLTVEEPKKTEVALDSEATSKATPNIVFGEASTTLKGTTETATTVSPFGLGSNIQSPSTTQSSAVAGSIFGKPVVTTSSKTLTSSSSIFGEVQTSTVTAASSVFSFATSPLIFGQTTPASTTTTTTMATTITTTTTTAMPTTSTSIFQITPSTISTVEKMSSTTSTTNIFGGGTIAATNVFNGSASMNKPIFGQASLSFGAKPSTQSIFGTSTPAVATTTSTTTTTAPGQVSSATTSTSVFTDSVAETANFFSKALSDGNKTEKSSTIPATSATSVFGERNAPIFGNSSSNAFGQTTSSNLFFGQSICSPFGKAVTSSQSTFESGAGGGFGSRPTFGQNLFGQGTNNTSAFGDSTSTSIFGGSSTSSGGNAFQTATTTAFGLTSPGPFSNSQGSVAETGFMASNTFQEPLGGFGSPPVFGGGPSASTFGSSFSFSGSSSTFGLQPTFGSRPGIFDSSQGGFSQPQGSTTFENLANQNTVGFENLAKQSQGQGFGGFTSSPAFENKPAFGGSSFSNWRSN